MPNVDWKWLVIGVVVGVVLANKIRSVVPVPSI